MDGCVYLDVTAVERFTTRRYVRMYVLTLICNRCMLWLLPVVDRAVSTGIYTMYSNNSRRSTTCIKNEYF
jgi:hypothetical protein